MRIPRLQKYGITTEMYREAKNKGLKWCGWHKRFEDKELFHKHCKLCKDGSRERNRLQYEKYGNARKHHAPKNYYQDTFIAQGEHCALCMEAEGHDYHVRLHIDHDHNCCDKKNSCGKCLRGLLCWECNHMLGRLEITMSQAQIIPYPDTWVDRALAYLNKWREIHQSQTQDSMHNLFDTSLAMQEAYEKSFGSVAITNIQVP